MPNRLKRFFPILEWGREYNSASLSSDMIAALIVTIMLIPQSLAYALLAGLPAEVGLYASILPLVAYAIFGTSRTLAVGPVAVASLMTAAAVGKVASTGTDEYLIAAITLAFLSGVFLVILGLARLGFLANFLSHPVIAGFITASGLIIAISQVKHLLGVSASGDTLIELLESLYHHISGTNWNTLMIGLGSLVFLFWVRSGLNPLLLKLGLKKSLANAISKGGPVLAVVVTTLIAWGFNLGDKGVALVGDVPSGLPSLAVPSFSMDLWSSLVGSAIIISIIGFVESISVAQTLAAKRRQRVHPNQELIAMGASNLSSAFSGGFPVTGGFSRSVVNFDAGAVTPAAGVFTAVGIALATLFLTPLLAYLPKATLAATIIVAVLSLVDFSVVKKAWNYSIGDFLAVTATILLTLLEGVELGVMSGVVLSIFVHLYKSSRPHIAVVGQIPGTEHYRNIKNHEVITEKEVLSIRVDESLYFANARYLEDKVYDLVAKNQDIKHVVLLCSAVNELDMSATESLEAITHRLQELGILFHLSEVKRPVMNVLETSGFIEHMTGNIYMSHQAAMDALTSA